MPIVTGILPAVSRKPISLKLWLAVVFPIIVSGMFWSPSLMFAADDVIRVISDKQSTSFSENVSFDLKLEGQDQIIRVTLHYRIVPSEIWNFTHLDFVPSENIETTIKIETSGAKYLPPGVEFEYFYTILDSAGIALDTTLQRFQYMDDRFEWQSRKAGPITLLYHNLDESWVTRVANQVTGSLSDLSALLETDFAEGATGVIYNKISEATQAFPFQSQAATQEPLFRGFAFPEQAIFVGVGFDAGLIIHESAHLLLDEALSSAGGGVLPSWVNEGFATYAGREGEPRRPVPPLGIDPNLISLRHMSVMPSNPESIEFFYVKAGSVVGFLVEEYGDQAFRNFLTNFNSGQGTEVSLESAYGFGVDELDSKWSSAPLMDPDPVDDGRPFPFYLSSSLLLSMLALLVFAATVYKYLGDKLGWREKDGSPWSRMSDEEWEDRP